jgi:hypothetical protein
MPRGLERWRSRDDGARPLQPLQGGELFTKASQPQLFQLALRAQRGRTPERITQERSKPHGGWTLVSTSGADDGGHLSLERCQQWQRSVVDPAFMRQSLLRDPPTHLDER